MGRSRHFAFVKLLSLYWEVRKGMVRNMQQDMTEGPITASLIRFTVPLMIGNLLQQFYNIADTWIVGRFLGANALAAVGASYTLMVFLTSILSGLCMGSGAVCSIHFGGKEEGRLKSCIFVSFILIAGVAVVMNLLAYVGLNGLIRLLQAPEAVMPLMRDYLWVIFLGITASFFYNYFASLLRAVGNSVIPLVFLGVASVLNIALDVWFVQGVGWGVKGAAAATVLSQYVSGFGMMGYTLFCCPKLRVRKEHMRWRLEALKEIIGMSFLTCTQQSVMNLGILMVQGLVNSFGAVVMAAFAVAVKIDSFAYMPVQDFGNAFSTYVAQNYGAGREDRIRKGIRSAGALVFFFCICISLMVCLFARPLMEIFVSGKEVEIIETGVCYLRIEGAFYVGIGVLFLLYGFYRAVRRPGMSVALTMISLGIRVALAYLLSSAAWIGVIGIWIAVPIGWALADVTGVGYYWWRYRKGNG